jgi:hypothetical protein
MRRTAINVPNQANVNDDNQVACKEVTLNLRAEWNNIGGNNKYKNNSEANATGEVFTSV